MVGERYCTDGAASVMIGPMTIAEQMIPELEAECEMTRRLLARVSADKLDWTPGHDLHSIGWNANHLVEIVGWVSGILQENGLDLAAPEGQPSPPATDVQQLLEQFDSNVAQAIASLEGIGDSTMDEPWTLRMGTQDLFTMKKGPCIRKWVFTHMAHHRGILNVYLRMAGLNITSVYEA